jgi:hypothetical protein
MNSKQLVAYEFEMIKMNDGMFDESVDATYIIHLVNNGRYEHIMEQLTKYHPTSTVYIVMNKGYKNSVKQPFITNSSLDLVDAFITVFKHAKKYNNILVLEDDFIFSDEIMKHQHNVNKTIQQLDTNFMYLLGCIPFFQIPYNLYNYRVFLSLGTHAIVYSKEHRNNTLKYDQKKITDWDFYSNRNTNRIMYYTPLCYQLFPDTENSKMWCKDKDLLVYYMCIFLRGIFKLLKLDTAVEPGTSFYYVLSKCVPILLCIIILLILKRCFR